MNVIDTFRLTGRTAVATGGAGLYGRQIVSALAEAGASVYTASRDLDTLQEYTDGLCQFGLDVHALRLDQSDPDSVAALLDSLVSRDGRVDVLVNNAVSRPMGTWGSESDTALFADSMKVNATGLYTMLPVFGDHMAENAGGSIINIGSIQGMVGPDMTLYEGLGWTTPPPDYFFHKGGMINLSRYAASQLGPKGVRVNTVSAGGFFDNQDPVFVERYNARTMLGRMAGDTDLKATIVFLASDASSYITGANIVVDGGYTAK